MTDTRPVNENSATSTDSSDYLLMDSLTNGTQKISPLNLPIPNSVQTELDLKAVDSAVVHKTGGEEITGQKNFTNASNIMYGVGTNLTALNATNITSGTLNAARLPASGATAATYKNPTMTVDVYGRTTSISNGIDYEAASTKTGNYTLTQSDNGCRIRVNTSTSATITIPDSLSAGFSCLVIQKGSAQVSFATSGSMVLHSSNGYTKTAKQYSIVTIIIDEINEAIIGGDCV
jgi:hypothetical protein